MTNERNCPLAKFCRHAGDEAICTKQCSAFISVSSRYQNAHIPQEYRNLYLKNSPARTEQSQIYEVLEKYVETFAKDDVRIKNLYLYSQSPGTGKTTTAIVMLNEYIRRRFMYYVSKKQNVPEVLALFLDINEMQTKYNLASMSHDDEDITLIKDAVIRYSNVEFLVVDDIGVRSATESFRALVHSIINSRVTRGLPTVFTSNVRIEDLKSVLDERLQDRIEDQALFLTFKGESKRGRR